MGFMAGDYATQGAGLQGALVGFADHGATRPLRDRLVDRRAISGRRDRLAFFFCDFNPEGAGGAKFSQRLFGCAAERGTVRQVGDVGDVTIVVVAPEYVDVVVLHGPSSTARGLSHTGGRSGATPVRRRIVAPGWRSLVHFVPGSGNTAIW